MRRASRRKRMPVRRTPSLPDPASGFGVAKQTIVGYEICVSLFRHPVLLWAFLPVVSLTAIGGNLLHLCGCQDELDDHHTGITAAVEAGHSCCAATQPTPIAPPCGIDNHCDQCMELDLPLDTLASVSLPPLALRPANWQPLALPSPCALSVSRNVHTPPPVCWGGRPPASPFILRI